MRERERERESITRLVRNLHVARPFKPTHVFNEKNTYMTNQRVLEKPFTWGLQNKRSNSPHC